MTKTGMTKTWASVSIHLGDDLPSVAFTPPDGDHMSHGMAHVHLGDGSICATDSASLLALADALQEAARPLRRAEIADGLAATAAWSA